MKHAHPDTACPSLDRGRVANDASPDTENVSGGRWRAALAALVNAPVRLHRYRNLHTAVLEDAIRAYDCSQPCGKDS